MQLLLAILIISLIVLIILFAIKFSFKKNNSIQNKSNVISDFTAEENIISLINTGMTLSERDIYNLKQLKNIIRTTIKNSKDYEEFMNKSKKKNITIIIKGNSGRYSNGYAIYIQNFYECIDSDRYVSYIDISENLYKWYSDKNVILKFDDIFNYQ